MDMSPEESPMKEEKIHTDNWVDVQQSHINYPSTFDAPDITDIAAVRPGNLVKISFPGSIRSPGERFWVEVTKCEEQGGNAFSKRFVGIVSNILIFDRPYNRGDLVTFVGRNIYDIRPE
ncbi:MAG: hypothetical protein Solivirus2_58 [Solivirus sp.]|uniref:Uncharacterized protein n=1 Tax=Solivirus sp. TaxID=2487772 RepID=A0A3G5AFN3_9VIRU|nr:MAG: hypothetical protein Solivirus2_58 [Solivirus sp.]